MRTRNLLSGLALASLLSLGMSAANTFAADLPPLSHNLVSQTPRPAPALRLKGLDGTSHDLARLKGRVVLVNFWATWCPPCRREMPSMERLSQALKNEAFSVLAVDVGEGVDVIELFTSQLDTTLSFPILLDKTSKTMQTWNVAGLPTTYLVDRQGRIVATAVGGREFDHPDIIRTIRDLLRK